MDKGEDAWTEATGPVKRLKFTVKKSRQIFHFETDFPPESADIFRRSPICMPNKIQRDTVYLKKYTLRLEKVIFS